MLFHKRRADIPIPPSGTHPPLSRQENDEFRVVSNGIAKLPGGAQLSANEDVAGRELPTPGCISGGL